MDDPDDMLPALSREAARTAEALVDSEEGSASERLARSAASTRQVTVGPRLMFVTDTMTPVLTHGAPDRVEAFSQLR